jgi:hypothetical protein
VWGDILERLNATSKQFQAVYIDLGVVAELCKNAMDNFNFYEEAATKKRPIREHEGAMKQKKKRKLRGEDSR